MPVTVRIFMSRYHQQISLSAATQPVMADKIVEYGCRTEGSKPNANIEWFLDDQRIIVPSKIASNSVDNDFLIQKTASYQWMSTSFNNCIVNDDSNIVNGNEQMVNQIAKTTTSSSSEMLLSNDNSNWKLTVNEQINYPNNLLSQQQQQQRQKNRRRCKFLSIMETHKTNSTLSIIRFIPDFSDNNRILSCQASNPFIAMADNNNNNNMTANNSFSSRSNNNNSNNNNRITDKITLNIQCMYNISVFMVIFSEKYHSIDSINDNNNNISHMRLHILIGNFCFLIC